MGIPKLIFGDPKSIAIRDKAMVKNVMQALKDKGVCCPYCKTKIRMYYEHNINQKVIGLSFCCNKTCPNSAEYIESGMNPDISKTTFSFSGELLD